MEEKPLVGTDKHRRSGLKMEIMTEGTRKAVARFGTAASPPRYRCRERRKRDHIEVDALIAGSDGIRRTPAHVGFAPPNRTKGRLRRRGIDETARKTKQHDENLVGADRLRHEGEDIAHGIAQSR